ncbi:MAG TPA: low-specificity L-threonine aldolase [Dehalococcoidia bacterium]|jgi:threonine aldolase|nr:low-specificity L-threonine aldolase [Dehalococcoidia bacterium]
MNVIDLRSDTVTLPSPEMRRAMAEAELGDDVFGEDPTVNRLQAMAAEMLGKEAALLVTSGTQGNLAAMLAHCHRGDEVILGELSHSVIFEVGGASALGGLVMKTVRNDSGGRLDLGQVRAAIPPPNDHFARAGLISVENTHNQCGGVVLNEEDLSAVRDLAHRRGLPVHMDGARIFNAAVALGVPVSRLAGYVDSVTFCLSKGLGCPVGSVLCGSREFIAEARRYRKMLGGGMRQAGVIAAAGVFALESMVERLAEDHDNASAAANGLAEIAGIALAPAPQTNLIYFTVEGWDLGKFVARLAEAGVLCFDEGGRIRWVTHYGIERADVEEAVARTRSVMAAGA